MTTPCPTCDHIHTPRDVYAVGRFDPTGVRGYAAHIGGELSGELYPTRDEAMAAVCAERASA